MKKLLGFALALTLWGLAMAAGDTIFTATPSSTATATPTHTPSPLKDAADYAWRARIDVDLKDGMFDRGTRWYVFTDEKPGVENKGPRFLCISATDARVDPPGKGNAHYYAAEVYLCVGEKGDIALEQR